MSEAHPEIVIIRRGSHGDHDEHHGGVWKIAFADFMTAMMAFFLVMWLISANDKTRASVARYFNPVRLVDATTQPRGLHDTKKDESGITASPDNKKADDKKEKPGGAGPEKSSKATGPSSKPEDPVAREARLDKALRDEPLVALAEIVAAKPTAAAVKATPPRASAAGGPGRGGEAYRDPFAPAPPALLEAPSPTTKATDDPAEKSETPPKVASEKTGDRTDHAQERDKAARGIGGAEAGVEKSAPPAAMNAASDKTIVQDSKPGPDRAADLKKLLDSIQKSAGSEAPHISLQQTADGLLLSLADRENFSMFANGSAVPSRRLVILMEEIGKVLKSRPGAIVIRGFTDSKQFRSRRYDNWHLSLDRAQVTHYMLVRGGVPDARFDHVEGYADHDSKKADDPSNPLNRRIDILIKDAA